MVDAIIKQAYAVVSADTQMHMLVCAFVVCQPPKDKLYRVEAQYKCI